MSILLADGPLAGKVCDFSTPYAEFTDPAQRLFELLPRLKYHLHRFYRAREEGACLVMEAASLYVYDNETLDRQEIHRALAGAWVEVERRPLDNPSPSG